MLSIQASINDTCYLKVHTRGESSRVKAKMSTHIQQLKDGLLYLGILV